MRQYFQDYHRQGFLFLQLALDASLIYYTNKSVKVDADSIGGNEIFLRRFPYPKFVDDFLLKALESTLPLIFMLSFIYPVISTTRSIVIEKEKRLKVDIFCVVFIPESLLLAKHERFGVRRNL